MSDDDPLIAMRAALDQAIAGFDEQARVLYAYHISMTKAGFTPEQALVLTGELLRLIFTAGDGE